MEFGNSKNKIDNILLSPSRQTHPRACKSPSKVEVHQGDIRDGKKDSREIYENHIAKDLVKNFPAIHEHFDIVKKVGEGTFSKVYLAKYRKHPKPMIAIKHLIPTSSPKRIENELKCLKIVGGKNNVIGIECALRKDDHIIFMLPYLSHQSFSSYFRSMKNDAIKNYMRNLLVALKHVHSFNIIHRDVKPSNFIFCRERNDYNLIDFGLAMPVPGTKGGLLKDYNNKPSDRVLKPVNLNRRDDDRRKVNLCNHNVREVCRNCMKRPRQSAPRAGTPGFRAPEVLMKYPNQTTAVDMWAAGVILLSLLSRRYPFFTGKDDMEALAQIKTLYSTADIKRMAHRIDKVFECSLGREENILPLRTVCKKLANRSCIVHPVRNENDRKRPSDDNVDIPSKRLKSPDSRNHSLCTNPCEERTTSDRNQCICIEESAFDLLDELLTLDPFKRITAKDALRHPFITTSAKKSVEGKMT